MTKINLGSGPASAKGWINYDWGLLPFLGKYRLTPILIKLGLLPKAYDWKWPKICLVDIRKSLPDKDNSVDYIYCSHVLEHFEKYEACNILKECRRILKKDGCIRLVLPDLKKLTRYYQNSEIFNREYFGYDKDQYYGFTGDLKKMFIRGHQWMYDINSAKKILKDAGFGKVELCRYRKGRTPNLVNLDIEQHKRLSLYLEAYSRPEESH